MHSAYNQKATEEKTRAYSTHTHTHTQYQVDYSNQQNHGMAPAHIPC